MPGFPGKKGDIKKTGIEMKERVGRDPGCRGLMESPPSASLLEVEEQCSCPVSFNDDLLYESFFFAFLLIDESDKSKNFVLL
jgi:hypothetical protein